MNATKRIRLELDERRARTIHTAVREALSAHLLDDDGREAAYDILDQLDDKIPGWLGAQPLGGEAGYLAAAEAVLRALVDAEDSGRLSLTETELLDALRGSKPPGTSPADVLKRMRREMLITIKPNTERRYAAAPAGRRFLHRDTSARDNAWTVRDADTLLDVIYAEHRPGRTAHRPCVQAIGRLSNDKLRELLDALIGRDLLVGPATPLADVDTLELTLQGVDLARERWQQSAPPGVYRSAFRGPPAPPMPFRKGLPLRIGREDASHPVREGYSYACPPAAWLRSSSKTKLLATLKRDGAVAWTCRHCGSSWIVYLQAFASDKTPTYGSSAMGTHNRPLWRPTYLAARG